MKHLFFCYIDDNYLNYLRTLEPHIPYISTGSNRKFMCGVILDVGGICYYAPVSSNTSGNTTNFLIRQISSNGSVRLVASVRLGFMFPAPRECVQRLDLGRLRSIDPRYADLVALEGRYCRQHSKKLLKLAKKLREGKIPAVQFHCNNFELLEARFRNYNPANIY